MSSVLQPWMEELSWKEQTVILCALRGSDSHGSPDMKAITRWIRRVALKNAAPSQTFMRDEGFPEIYEIAEKRPLILDMLHVHFLSHMMHALQVIGYRHPDAVVANRACHAYYQICEYLHVGAELNAAMRLRLRDEVEMPA